MQRRQQQQQPKQQQQQQQPLQQSNSTLQQQQRQLRRVKKGGGVDTTASSWWCRVLIRNIANDDIVSPAVLIPVLMIVLFLALAVFGFLYEFYRDDIMGTTTTTTTTMLNTVRGGGGDSSSVGNGHPHPPQSLLSSPRSLVQLEPPLPVLPIFAPVPDAQRRIKETLQQHQPSIAGITALLQSYLLELHQLNVKFSAPGRAAQKNLTAMTIVQELFELTQKHLGTFDHAYSGEQPIFPVREDDSIFLSLAAFREHLLADTLRHAFDHAKYPDQLYVGVVVQNCFGQVSMMSSDSEDGQPVRLVINATGLPCRTGAQVIGKNPKTGRDMVQVSDAPPDPNGIADFCRPGNDNKYLKYCTNGQIRVLYVHETESLGPAMARYFASKLWAGETYFMQCDSHLLFAQDWDAKYIQELRATKSFPKSILSSYPPGFSNGAQNGDGDVVQESNGARLCTCSTLLADPNPIVRINTGRDYDGTESRPTQIPFLAAGFLFVRSEWLVDVPFDPYMPWLFMGEEIALSLRSWTHGWDLYAPRFNWIAHQYRPGRMGLPKFWGTVNRLFRKQGPGIYNTDLQQPVIFRVKHMVGYPDATIEKIQDKGFGIVLTDMDRYGVGTQRSREEYMEFAHMKMDPNNNVIQCTHNEWCNGGLKD